MGDSDRHWNLLGKGFTHRKQLAMYASFVFGAVMGWIDPFPNIPIVLSMIFSSIMYAILFGIIALFTKVYVETKW